MNNFTYELHGMNIVAFHNDKKDIHVLLEYNHEKGEFKAQSDYEMTKHFMYHGRNYDRTNYGNHDIYLKVLRIVKPYLKEAINKYFI